MDGDAAEIGALSEQVADYVRAHSAQGSDPGICLGRSIPREISEYGHHAQRQLVTQAQARDMAKRHGLVLRGLGGTEDGVIGALSAVGLAATGEDGRFIIIGRFRDLVGRQPVEVVLASGVVSVRTEDGSPVNHGDVDMDAKPRPALRDGQPILYVRWGSDCWQPVRLD
jgi:hypothetical protein